MRPLQFLLIAYVCCLSFARAETDVNQPPSPIPFLSWQDIKALYGPKKWPGDWDYPKIKAFPHQRELIEQCEHDLLLSVAADPNPFRMHFKLPPGKLSLRLINRDTDNRIIYFVFDYESELVTDLFIVFYYDPFQGRFILKSIR